MRLIDADALYERTCNLEAQALDYVGKLIERDGDETSTEWKIWSAILTERTAFKHDLFDAQTIEERKKGKWNRLRSDTFHCKFCGTTFTVTQGENNMNFCPNCGADLRGEEHDTN